MSFSLPQLNYSYSSLEPVIDEMTMTIHHTKHHQAYIDNLNKAVDGNPDLASKTLEELIANINSLPENLRNAVRNNGGGHWNHSFFWEILSPEKHDISQIPALAEAINSNFGSYTQFKEQLKAAALSRFGSGWVWLVKLSDGSLKITSTPNQDNPLMDVAEVKGKPILGLDVWEHAYYLKYQNKRADYVDALINIVNWKKVEELLSN